MINESYLSHAHVIKRDEIGKKILYYFPGYTNEIQLANPYLALYNSPSLTFTLLRGKEDVGGLYLTRTHVGGNKKSRQHKQQG